MLKMMVHGSYPLCIVIWILQVQRFCGKGVTRSSKRHVLHFRFCAHFSNSFETVVVALTELYCSWALGNCHGTEQPVPRCSHIKACTGQRCLNTLILSLHSSQTSMATAVATSPTTTASVMFCTQTQRGPALQESFVRPSKGSCTCLMIKHCFDPSLWRVLQYMKWSKGLSTHAL